MFLWLPFPTPAVIRPVSKEKPPKLAVLRSQREVPSVPIPISTSSRMSAVSPAHLSRVTLAVVDLRVETGQGTHQPGVPLGNSVCSVLRSPAGALGPDAWLGIC